MVENRSSVFGIIAMIMGAAGLGVGAYSAINFQVVEGIPGGDGQDAPGGLVVGILDPNDGETVSGDVAIRALVYGGENYTLSVLRNGTEIGTSLPLIWDTTLIADGCWNITIIVMDVITYNQSSDHVLVYVDNNLAMTRVYLKDPGYGPFSGGIWIHPNFDETSYDPENCFDLNTDSYNIPKDGYYLLISQVSMSLYDGESLMLRIVNSTGAHIGLSIAYSASVPTGIVTASFSDIQYLQQGDYLMVTCQHDGSTNRLLFGGEDLTYFSITCIA